MNFIDFINSTSLLSFFMHSMHSAFFAVLVFYQLFLDFLLVSGCVIVDSLAIFTLELGDIFS